MKTLKRLRGTRLTKSDVGYLISKVLLVVLLWIPFGIVLAVLSFSILNYTLDKLIQKVYKVHPLNSVDKNVFYDQLTNRCNIMGFFVLHKCEEASIKTLLTTKLPGQHVRFRS